MDLKPPPDDNPVVARARRLIDAARDPLLRLAFNETADGLYAICVAAFVVRACLVLEEQIDAHDQQRQLVAHLLARTMVDLSITGLYVIYVDEGFGRAMKDQAEELRKWGVRFSAYEGGLGPLGQTNNPSPVLPNLMDRAVAVDRRCSIPDDTMGSAQWFYATTYSGASNITAHAGLSAVMQHVGKQDGERVLIGNRAPFVQAWRELRLCAGLFGWLAEAAFDRLDWTEPASTPSTCGYDQGLTRDSEGLRPRPCEHHHIAAAASTGRCNSLVELC